MDIKELIEALRSHCEDKFPLNEMSNFSGKELNLPVNIWIDGPRNLKHGKRVKIQNNYSTKFQEDDLISMTISDDPKLGKVFKRVKVSNSDLKKVRQWILLNKEVLLKYTEGEMSTQTLVNSLVPLP